MITTIFLDLDDTLFSFQQAEQVALEETMRHYTLPYSDEILALYSAGTVSYTHLTLPTIRLV